MCDRLEGPTCSREVIVRCPGFPSREDLQNLGCLLLIRPGFEQPAVISAKLTLGPDQTQILYQGE